jgi:hypothetical protein
MNDKKGGMIDVVGARCLVRCCVKVSVTVVMNIRCGAILDILRRTDGGFMSSTCLS